MAGERTAVFGIYTTRRGAENAVDSLKVMDSGHDISVLLPENKGVKEFRHTRSKLRLLKEQWLELAPARC